MKILKVTTFFSERIWGGNRIAELGFDTNQQKNIGEAWIISAHPNGLSFLQNDKSISLKSFYEGNKSRFNVSSNSQYPLLTKIISSNDYLSVQVHPNDEYASLKHNELGKPEAWYIIDCPDDAQIIYGHNYKNREDFTNDLNKNKWDSILKYVNVSKGDFIDVPTGKIHAITPGVTVFEIQRSSDITYRLYDFDRLDLNGKKRKLDLEYATDCISFPDSKNIIIKNFINEVYQTNFFSIICIDVKEEHQFEIKKTFKCLQVCVIEGFGTINNIKFETWDSAIVIDFIDDNSLILAGGFKVIVCWIQQ